MYAHIGDRTGQDRTGQDRRDVVDGASNDNENTNANAN